MCPDIYVLPCSNLNGHLVMICPGMQGLHIREPAGAGQRAHPVGTVWGLRQSRAQGSYYMQQIFTPSSGSTPLASM